jgi:hypothetical protein
MIYYSLLIKLGINWMFLEISSVFRLNFECTYILNSFSFGAEITGILQFHIFGSVHAM